MDGYFTQTSLLTVPVKRAAFSDRTAYVMAEISRLAYFKFEATSNVQEVIRQVRELMAGHPNLDRVTDLIMNQFAGSSASNGVDVLRSILGASGFKLIDQPFNNPATDAQGFLCVNTDQDVAILAFRGTEKRYKDIKADVDAKLRRITVGNQEFEVHEGYYEQFTSVESDIRAALAKVAGKQLMITGHSLGGALAIVATKILAVDTTGACYTFGSPPVGTIEFDRNIKTPIYRVVNHVDIVPHLPSPLLVYGVRGLIWSIAFVLRLIPYVDGILAAAGRSKWYVGLKGLLYDAARYRQSGYGSYLVGNGTKLQLRYNLDATDEFRLWGRAILNMMFRREFEILADHSIAKYAQKLSTWALGRSRM